MGDGCWFLRCLLFCLAGTGLSVWPEARARAPAVAGLIPQEGLEVSEVLALLAWALVGD